MFVYVLYMCVCGWVFHKCYANGSVFGANISVFAVKTKGKKWPIRTYKYTCVRMHVGKIKIYSSRICVCPLTERVYMYVRSDIEVHGKFSNLNDGKDANFVFLLAVSSPIFSCFVSVKMSRLWRAGSAENVEGRESEWESETKALLSKTWNI